VALPAGDDEDDDQDTLDGDGDDAACRVVTGGGKAKTSPELGTTRLVVVSPTDVRGGT
jgi:hypothetical protein